MPNRPFTKLDRNQEDVLKDIQAGPSSFFLTLSWFPVAKTTFPEAYRSASGKGHWSTIESFTL
jgi:hypothetical protein